MKNMIRPSAEQSVIAAGFDLLNENPKASLAEIASHAGVGRATLHRHFSGREDLIRAMAWTAIREMDQAVEAACSESPSYSDAIRQMLGALIPLGDRYQFLLREPVEDHADIAAEFQKQQHEMRELVDAAKNEGLFDTAVPTDWITRSFDNILYAAWESVMAEETTPSQATTLAWQTLVHGLGANKNGQ
ncbi:transcriptional regulator, TetR family [Parasphingorhabdus marina DSM 22363]|uniref:Transcriptional regulator, TetR family n=1 Tax=Parasphingorhabdus marina DSM 22363 TaxID=1123272 RepID=A0A1N6GMK1_9SPHN|nr:TetR/AcrR family transcriptional regulator [Parasphingorhabdus marina]SIO08745.1 transcriptional regulator, TetR family [Parasphingorhabdus marina DSM 22363]